MIDQDQKSEQGLSIFLRKLEKYTKVNMVYFVEGGLWVFMGQIAATLSSFVLAVAFAHFLTKESYGQYKYVLSLAGIVGAFSLTGMGTSVVQAVARGFEGVVRKAFWLNMKWGILITAISFGAAIYYFLIGHDFYLGGSWLIIGLFLPIFLSSQLYGAYLNGKKDFRKKTIYETVQIIIPSMFILAAVILTDNPLFFVFLYFFVNSLLALIFYITTVRNSKRDSLGDDDIGIYSKHLSFMNMLETVSSNIDKVLVFNYLGALELARYAFAISIPEQVKPFLKGLNSLILPRFSERESKDIAANIGRKILFLFLFNLALVIAYLLLAPLIYKTFFPKYQEVVIYSQIFSLSLFAGSITPIEIFLVAKKKVREQYIIRVTVSIFQIAAVFSFVFMWGLWGLIWARMATRFFSSCLNLFFYYCLPSVKK